MWKTGAIIFAVIAIIEGLLLATRPAPIVLENSGEPVSIQLPAELIERLAANERELVQLGNRIEELAARSPVVAAGSATETDNEAVAGTPHFASSQQVNEAARRELEDLSYRTVITQDDLDRFMSSVERMEGSSRDELLGELTRRLSSGELRLE